MRSKSPELMSEIKKYIEDYYLQNRQSPSTTKIAEAVGIARGTAYKYLVEMAEKNMIEYDGQEIRTNVTRKYSGEQTQTPIVGSIPCGSPQYEEENIEEYVSLPTAIFGKGDFFILRAKSKIKWKPKSCTRGERNPDHIAKNYLHRDFHADKPNEKWLTDVSELQMRISYNKLQKLMIDNQMKRQDLMRAAEISSSVATKLNKNETVSLDVLMRICKVFHCNIGD